MKANKSVTLRRHSRFLANVRRWIYSNSGNEGEYSGDASSYVVWVLSQNWVSLHANPLVTLFCRCLAVFLVNGGPPTRRFQETMPTEFKQQHWFTDAKGEKCTDLVLPFSGTANDTKQELLHRYVYASEATYMSIYGFLCTLTLNYHLVIMGADNLYIFL